MQTPNTVHRQLQMPAVTSRPGYCQIRLSLENPQSHHFKPVVLPDAVSDSTPTQDAKPVEPLSISPCLKHPKLVTIEIEYEWRYGDGSRIAAGIGSHIVSFEDLCVVKAIYVPVLLRVCIFLISVTKLWDMIVYQCMCKDRRGHAKVLDSKSHWLMASKLEIDLHVAVTLESKTYNRVEIESQPLSQWCRTSHRTSGRCTV